MPRTIRKRKRVRNISRKVVENPSKGLNTFVSPTLIDDRESSDLKNIAFSESGVVQKRSGAQTVGSGLSTDARGLGVFSIAGGNSYVLTVDGTALKYLNGTTWTSISGATFNSSAQIDFVQARDDLYIFDGNSGIAKLDNTLTLTRPTTTVSASFGIFYQGVHFVSGVTTQESRVYMSTVTDASDFTDSGDDATSHPGSSAWADSGSDYFDVQKDDGDVVTGFAKFQDVLIIFKRRSVYQVTLDDSGSPVVTQVSTGIGAVNHKSIENVENDVFFLSADGYYVLGNEPNYFNEIRTNELSARVRPVIDTISTANENKAASIYFKNQFISSFPVGGSTNNTTLMYDRRYLAWSKWTDLMPNSWAVYVDDNNESHLYFAADDEAEVYELETGTYNDDGVAIDSYWVSKSIDLGDFDVYKRWVDVTLLFRKLAGEITISIYTDGDELVFTQSISTTSTAGMGIEMLGETTLGTTGGTVDSSNVVNIPYRIRVNKNSRTIKFKIENNRTNENFLLLGYSLGYYPFSHYKFDSAYKLQG